MSNKIGCFLILIVALTAANCATAEQSPEPIIILGEPNEPGWMDSFRQEYSKERGYLVIEYNERIIEENNGSNPYGRYPYDQQGRDRIEDELEQKKNKYINNIIENFINSEILKKVYAVDTNSNTVERATDDAVVDTYDVLGELKKVLDIGDIIVDKKDYDEELSRAILLPVVLEKLSDKLSDIEKEIKEKNETAIYINITEKGIADITGICAIAKNVIEEKLVDMAWEEIEKHPWKQEDIDQIKKIYEWKEKLVAEGLLDRNRYVSSFVVSYGEEEAPNQNGFQEFMDKYNHLFSDQKDSIKDNGVLDDLEYYLPDPIVPDTDELSKSSLKLSVSININDRPIHFTLYYWAREAVMRALIWCGHENIRELESENRLLSAYLERNTSKAEEGVIGDKKNFYDIYESRFNVYESIFKSIKHEDEEDYYNYVSKVADLEESYKEQLLAASSYEGRVLVLEDVVGRLEQVEQMIGRRALLLPDHNYEITVSLNNERGGYDLLVEDREAMVPQEINNVFCFFYQEGKVDYVVTLRRRETSGQQPAFFSSANVLSREQSEKLTNNAETDFRIVYYE